MTTVAEPPAKSHKSRLPHYYEAVQKLLAVSEGNARLLAARLANGSTTFPDQALDLHPVGVGKDQIADYKEDLEKPGGNALRAQFGLAQAERVNRWRQREFRRWLGSCLGLPPQWVDQVVGALRPEVTYIRFIADAGTLLVEYN